MANIQGKVHVLEGSQCMALEVLTEAMDDHPLWICKFLVDGPEIAKEMHKEYLAAGSDVLLSLTYQVSVEELMKVYKVTPEEAIQIIQSSVDIAKTAWKESKSPKRPIIAGSIGPYGALLHDGSEYTGEYVKTVTPEMLIDWHRPRVKALVDAGVDFLCFETLPSVIEALALIQLLREFPNQKAWISFTCKPGNITAFGENFGESLAKCWNRAKDQILALGCNCTQPHLITNLLQSARTALNNEPVPLVVYPNSGELYNVEKGHWAGERTDLGKLALEWLPLGVKYIGGCCRTTSQDIKNIRHVVDEWRAKNINLYF